MDNEVEAGAVRHVTGAACAADQTEDRDSPECDRCSAAYEADRTTRAERIRQEPQTTAAGVSDEAG